MEHFFWTASSSKRKLKSFEFGFFLSERTKSIQRFNVCADYYYYYYYGNNNIKNYYSVHDILYLVVFFTSLSFKTAQIRPVQTSPL